MTFKQWQDLAHNLHDRKTRLLTMMDREIRETARRAGIDASIYPIHAHNAMCSLNSGHPWKGVNYSLVRRVLYLERRMWEPSRLIDKILQRAWQQVKP